MSEEDRVRWGKIESGIRYFSENHIKYDPDERRTVIIEVDRILKFLNEARKEFPVTVPKEEVEKGWFSYGEDYHRLLNYKRKEWFEEWLGVVGES